MWNECWWSGSGDSRRGDYADDRGQACLRTCFVLTAWSRPTTFALRLGDHRIDRLRRLLVSRNNRMVWGGMTALCAIAPVAAREIFAFRAEVVKAVADGSVITSDNGVHTLALVAAQSPRYRAALMPFLLQHLERCRPKDVAQRAEKIAPAIDAEHRDAFANVLSRRLSDLSAAGAKRVARVLRAVRQK